jgi:hypothetical protein
MRLWGYWSRSDRLSRSHLWWRQRLCGLFALVPMADHMFRAANIPRRLMPAAVGLGAFTFAMWALPGSPSRQ